MKFWKEFWNDESGAVATEYVVLVGLVAIALVVTIVAFKDRIINFFQGAEQGIQNVTDHAEEGSDI